jgi:TonB family protein
MFSSIARGMIRALFLLCCAAAIAGIFASVAHAQDQSPRRLLNRVTPKYPEYLKTHDIGGVVRLSITVSPSGNVKTVAPVGGNPILIDAAVEAVKQWKYAPGEESNTFEVKVDFVPRHTNN